MSYDIYFVKKKGISISEIDVLLEENAKMTDDHYISKELMVSIHQRLSKEGLQFEIFNTKDEDGDYYELNFPSYQVSIFNNMIAISLPYWDQNFESEIDQEVQTITSVLSELGFLTYDPQTNEIIETKKSVKKEFTETTQRVEKRIDYEPEPTTSMSPYIWISIGLAVFALIAWKVFKK